MIIGIPCEISSSESRIALVPDVVIKLIKLKIDVLVESNAGLKAGYTNDAFLKVGARIVKTKFDLLRKSNIICMINGGIFFKSMLNNIKIAPGLISVSSIEQFTDISLIRKIANYKITSFSMDMIPRISRAQSMDVLSSQANLAGYKAVILASNRINKIMPMFMTAAGTIPPAKVLILGAGVAGLQAIATAKRLGSVVYAYDVRSEVKEQVESLGAKFVNINIEESGEGIGGYAKELSIDSQALQRKRLGKFSQSMDIIISTAQIPGKKAPRLLNIDSIQKMKYGSIIVDLAAGSGGNIEGSKPGKEVMVNDALIIGPTNLASELAYNASSMYAQNVFSFLELILNKGNVNIDLNNEIIKQSIVTQNGKVINKFFFDN